MKRRLRSRILEFLNKNVLRDLERICNRKDIDNNDKVDLILKTLEFHNVPHDELGPGTNRVAVLIDGYVFKIAMDRWGIRDNLNEYANSQELYPYVTKVYETNETGLVTVSEYVTVISREEFMERTEEIREILSLLAESYLLGDVGTVTRNFCNWGYRDTGDLVILDFGYIYKIRADKLVCSKDGEPLDYDEDFHELICFRCGKKYTFMDIRRRISTEEEEEEHRLAKLDSYKLTKHLEEFTEEDDTQYEEDDYTSFLYKSNVTIKKEEEQMLFNKNENIVDEDNQSYLEAMNSMKKVRVENPDPEVEVIPAPVKTVDEDCTPEQNLIGSNSSKIVVNEISDTLVKSTTITQEEKVYLPSEESVKNIIGDVERLERLSDLIESVDNERNGIVEETDEERDDDCDEDEDESSVKITQDIEVEGDTTTISSVVTINDSEISQAVREEANEEAERLRAEIRGNIDQSRAEELAEKHGFTDYVE